MDCQTAGGFTRRLPVHTISSPKNFIVSSRMRFLRSCMCSRATPCAPGPSMPVARIPRACDDLGGGNPETGPFYIEGAFPGDTLVVKLNKVRLNRDSAGSGDTNRRFGAELRLYPSRRNTKTTSTATGSSTSEKGVARLKNPSEHLKNYTVKLQPMMGCIAVAPPAHQAMRTGFLGSYGGNMDYNQMREGTTLYLPVYRAGRIALHRRWPRRAGRRRVDWRCARNIHAG